MRCKIHPYEAGVGVCATCLRKRLLALLEAQNDPSTATAVHHQRHRNSDAPLLQPQPEPLVVFPRSFSPNISYRRSPAYYDAGRRDHCRQLLFFHTPQMGPTAFAVDCFPSADSSEISHRKQKFSLLKSLFGTPSRSSVSDHDAKRSTWLSTFSVRWRQRTSPTVCRWPSDRGMSPAEIASDGSMSENGYSIDSSAGRRRRLPDSTPLSRPFSSTPTHLHQHRKQPRDLSSFTLCLSPLVRPNPGVHRRSNAAESGLSGDFRGGSVVARWRSRRTSRERART